MNLDSFLRLILSIFLPGVGATVANVNVDLITLAWIVDVTKRMIPVSIGILLHKISARDMGVFSDKVL